MVSEELCCYVSCYFLLPCGGAGASTHLDKTRFRMEGIALFASAPFSAQRKNKRVGGNLPPEKRAKVETKNERKSNTEKQQNINDFGDIFAPKTDQKGVRKQLPTPSWLQERLGRLLGSILEPLGVILGAKKVSKNASTF